MNNFEIITSESHALLLRKYCRICGRKSRSDGVFAGIHLSHSDEYRSFLFQLHDTDVTLENAEIFPKQICKKCVNSLEKNVEVIMQNEYGSNSHLSLFKLVQILSNRYQTEDIRKIQQRFPLADFWAHSSSCQERCNICYNTSFDIDIRNSKSILKTVITCRTVTRELSLHDSNLTNAHFEIVEISTKKLSSIETGRKYLKTNQEETSENMDWSNQFTIDQALKKTSNVTNTKAIESSQLNSNQSHWSVLNDTLGTDKQLRADIISEILNRFRHEAPKVLTDLQSSGITYNSGRKKSAIISSPSAKICVSQCVNILNKVPIPKKSLLMFRAITDTASDGQLSVLSDVGININLTNPNLTFLLRRIKNNGTLNTNSISKASDDSANKTIGSQNSSYMNSINTLTNLKTLNKPSLSLNGVVQNNQLSNKSNQINNNQAKSQSVPVHQRSKTFGREKIDVNKEKVSKLLNEINTIWPANRQLRADIVRDIILDKPSSLPELAYQGIIFDANGGNYHLSALKRQRKLHIKQAEKVFDKISDKEWMALISDIVFDLLHPEDTLTLRTVGLFIDPLNKKVPLHFRMLFALKKALLLDDTSGQALSSNIMKHIENMLNIDGNKEKDCDILDGLTTLLYCDEIDAKKLIITSRSITKNEKTNFNDTLAKLQIKTENKPYDLPNIAKLDMKPVNGTEKNQSLSTAGGVKAPYSRPTGKGSRGPYKKNQQKPRKPYTKKIADHVLSNSNSQDSVVQEDAEETDGVIADHNLESGTFDPLSVGEDCSLITADNEKDESSDHGELDFTVNNNDELENGSDNDIIYDNSEAEQPVTTAFEETDNLATEEIKEDVYISDIDQATSNTEENGNEYESMEEEFNLPLTDASEDNTAGAIVPTLPA